MSLEAVQQPRSEAEIIDVLRNVEARAQAAALTGFEAWKQYQGEPTTDGALRQMAALCIADYQVYTEMVEYYDANGSWVNDIDGEDDPCSPQTLDNVLNRLETEESVSRHPSIPRMKAPTPPGGLDG